MIVIHRLVKHPTFNKMTWINVEKIKDVETGGKHTNLNEPIFCNFGRGLGFEVGSVDPLSDLRPKKTRKQVENTTQHTFIKSIINNDLPF
jgi:hypothetical protein